MATMTEAIRLVISGDSKGGVKALGDVAGAAEKTQGVFGKYGKGLNTAANYAAVGVVGLAAVIGKSVSTYNRFGDAVDTVTDLTNLSTESASLLAGQLQNFGVEASTAGTAVKLFERNLDSARQGNATMIESFARLGISAEELQTLGDDELLLRTRDAMASLDDKTARTALTLKVFGKAGAELADWLDVAPDDMAKLNAELEKAGLVWGDKELRTWQDMLDAQREMQVAMLGIQITIARDVVPALTPFVQLLGGLLRFLRPLAPVIVPATAALAVFVGVVKGAMIIQSTTTAVRGFYAAFKLTKMGTAITQMGNMRNLLPGLTTGLAGSALQWGAVGLAAGGAAVAIMQAYDAAKKYQDALDELKTATEGAQATLDMNASKLDPAFVAQQQAQINRDSKVNTPWYYYLNPAYAFLEGASKLATGGTVKAQMGGTIVRAAEAGEDEDFVPASKRESYARSVLARSRFARQPDAGSSSILVTGNTFVGTSRDAERTLTNIVSRRLGPQTARLERGRMAMANG